MKKLFSLLFSLLLVCGLSTSVSAYSIFSGEGVNEVKMENFELLFDDQGKQINLADQNVIKNRELQIGDVFLGIINVQNVNVNGLPYWNMDSIDNPNATDAINLSGIFAQKVVSIDATLGLVYLTNTSIFNFTLLDNSTLDISPYLFSGEMIALYVDTDTDGDFTAFEFNGSIQQDIVNATDSDSSAAYLTAGISDQALLDINGNVISGSDYAYSYATLGQYLNGFSAEAYAGLSVIKNNTGFAIFESVNDPGEDLYNTDVEIAFTTEIEKNSTAISPWMLASNDPAIMAPVPEPGTFLLFGFALIGAAAVSRKKINLI